MLAIIGLATWGACSLASRHSCHGHSIGTELTFSRMEVTVMDNLAYLSHTFLQIIYSGD